MTRTITIAANTISQLQRQLEVTGNNIANSQTHGFKSREASFSDLLTQQINNQPRQAEEIGRTTPLGIREGSGAFVVKSMLNLSQGAMQQTNRPLDIAFTQENQFLKVQRETNGVTENLFTRHGAMYLTPVNNGQLQLVTSDGDAVLDENNQPITFSQNLNQFSISETGVFTANNGTQTASFNLGMISVQKPQYLEQKANNLLGLPNNVEVDAGMIYTELTGANRNQIAIESNMLEASNVDLSKELSNMMLSQRVLQFQSRAISIGDQMLGLVNSMR